MIVTAWNNGAQDRNGKGYGFKVHPDDRDAFFQKDWDVILLEIEGEDELQSVTIPREGFWSEKGQELTSQALGRWLRKNGLAPWPRLSPPVFVLDPLEDNKFRVSKAKSGRKVF